MEVKVVDGGGARKGRMKRGRKAVRQGEAS